MIIDVLNGWEKWTIAEGDSAEILPLIPDASIHAIVADPPAGIAFMGKEWDTDKGGKAHWITWLTGILAEGYRVLKPGGHMLLWALPRTSHWTAEAGERAGFEIRDVIVHLFGSGFPKSLNVSKAIDARRVDDLRPVCRFLRAAMNAAGLSASDISARFGFHSRMVDHWAARDTDSQPTIPTPEQWEQLRGLLGFGAEMDSEVDRLNGRKGERGDAWSDREIIGEHGGTTPGLPGMRFSAETKNITAPATPEARTWDGWGTALKPAGEHWILFRRPLTTTIAANVLAHGTGALNIDAARVGTGDNLNGGAYAKDSVTVGVRRWEGGALGATGQEYEQPAGRFPANLVLSHAAWEETHCPCGAVLSFVARFCPECGSGDVEHRRAGCCAVGEKGVLIHGQRVLSGVKKSGGSGYEGGFGLIVKDAISEGRADPDGLETVTAWECLASCACGLSTLAPSGGAAPRCACGRGMSWACPVARLDEQSGESASTIGTPRGAGSGAGWGMTATGTEHADSGGASRFFNTFAPPDDVEPFFYCAKPSTAEAEAGCERLPIKRAHENVDREEGSAGMQSPRAGAGRTSGRRNHHPTKKSIALMRHFVRLVTPPGGIVLDMFAGSGTTIASAALEGSRAIGIEMGAEYVSIGRARATFWAALTGTQAAAEGTPKPKRDAGDERQRTIFDLLGGDP